MEYELRPKEKILFELSKGLDPVLWTDLTHLKKIPIDTIELPDQNYSVWKMSGKLNAAFFLSKLNPLQKQIVENKMAGYKIKEIAEQINQSSSFINYQLIKIRFTIRKFATR